MVMHRVALKKEYCGQGYGKKLFDIFIERAKIEGYRSLRIDTHEGNAVMRRLIEKAGFIYCGKAILTPDKVFQLVIPVTAGHREGCTLCHLIDQIAISLRIYLYEIEVSVIDMFNGLSVLMAYFAGIL